MCEAGGYHANIQTHPSKQASAPTLLGHGERALCIYRRFFDRRIDRTVAHPSRLCKARVSRHWRGMACCYPCCACRFLCGKGIPEKNLTLVAPALPLDRNVSFIVLDLFYYYFFLYREQ